jgi:hypothetical protein
MFFGPDGLRVGLPDKETCLSTRGTDLIEATATRSSDVVDGCRSHARLLEQEDAIQQVCGREDTPHPLQGKLSCLCPEGAVSGSSTE